MADNIIKRAYKHTAYWLGKQCGTLDVKQCGNIKIQKKYTSLGLQQMHKERYRNRTSSYVDYLNPYKTVSDLTTSISFNGALLAYKLGVFICDELKRYKDPQERERLKKEALLIKRRLQRPQYYAAETKRRRELAEERRKIRRRRTLAPQPTAEEILEAWDKRKESKAAMIRLGGMIHDLECYVDNFLKINEYGRIVGRRGGIRGWIKAVIPELAPKYKTLMRYKAMAVKLRQATQTQDPVPTKYLLEEKGFKGHSVVKEILSDTQNTFVSIIRILDWHLSPDTVLADPVRPPG